MDTTAKRDEIRRQKNKPWYVKSPWSERELKEALNEIDRLEKIEQRTKEACFKAGWEWIQSNINAQLPMLNRELSFMQAIDSAKIK